MVKHIFKLIWNEKRSNIWIFIEYILVFSILWFCSDFIYNTTKAYFSDTGYDIKDVFEIRMAEKPESLLAEANGGEVPEYDMAEIVDVFIDRVSRFPDIESVSISAWAMPYSLNNSNRGWCINNDSIRYSLTENMVSSGFFDVFRIEAEQGALFDWNEPDHRNRVVLIPLNPAGEFGSNNWRKSMSQFLPAYDVGAVEKLVNGPAVRNVIGYTKPLRRGTYLPNKSGYFVPFDKSESELDYNELAVRVKPGLADGFEERFMDAMYEQLQIGPYYLSEIRSLELSKKDAARGQGFSGQIKTVYAVSFFIMVNIFIGIMGTFWFRTQSRRSEIALRMALGSPRKKIMWLFMGETLLLLLLASVVATIICVNISNEAVFYDFMDIDFLRTEWGIGSEQDILNYLFSFLFLAAVSLFAVWYPAKKAAETQAAEVLNEE